MKSDPELRALVRELREAASAVALSATVKQPPAALKARVLREISGESAQTRTKETVFRAAQWIPWAIAAGLLIFCGVLLNDREQLRRELTVARSVDPLMRTKFIALSPDNGAPADAKAMVAWESDKQTRVIRVVGMPAAESGKDYQLWAIDANYKDPVSAGIVHVDPSGIAQARFKPEAATNRVKAFALTLERKGGVPKAEGPILLVGKN